jgi:hypothetical protein
MERARIDPLDSLEQPTSAQAHKFACVLATFAAHPSQTDASRRPAGFALDSPRLARRKRSTAESFIRRGITTSSTGANRMPIRQRLSHT